VVVPVAGEARRVAAGEEVPVAVQPSLGLQEGEEEEARDVEERQLSSLALGRVALRRRGQVDDHALEGPVEAAGEGLAPEHVEPPGVREHVVDATRRGERPQRLRVAVDEATPVDEQRDDSRSLRLGRPRGDRQLVAAARDGEHYPQQVGRARREPPRNAADGVPERAGTAVDRHEQRAQRTGTARHTRVDHLRGEAECRAGVGVERRRQGAASQLGGERCERVEGRGARKQGGGGAERLHPPTVPPHAPTPATARRRR
jgi:hypothetical protein